MGDFESPSFEAQVSLAKVNPMTGDQEPGANIDAKETAATTAVQPRLEHLFNDGLTAPALTTDQQAVEDIGSEAISAATKPIDIETIRACVFDASDANDLRRRLAIVMADADVSAFEASLSKALAAADVLGYRSAA